MIFSAVLAYARRASTRSLGVRKARFSGPCPSFAEGEPDGVPDWMNERIRATDIQQFIDWLLAWPDWKWNEWESLPHVAAPTLLLAGELEDREDETGKAASVMPNGTRIRVVGQGHINAFIKSPLILPHVTAFLAKHGS